MMSHGGTTPVAPVRYVKLWVDARSFVFFYLFWREEELLRARPIVAMALAGRGAKTVHHKEGIDAGQSPSDHDASLASF
ncbi:MAG: hypothetical protein P8189_14725 [Anaerolineae bacterium]